MRFLRCDNRICDETLQIRIGKCAIKRIFQSLLHAEALCAEVRAFLRRYLTFHSPFLFMKVFHSSSVPFVKESFRTRRDIFLITSRYIDLE